MDCAACGESFNSQDQREVSLPCTHSLCGKCCSRLPSCPDCGDEFTLAEIRLVAGTRGKNGTETVLASLGARSCRLKSALADLRAQRDKVRGQNASFRAGVAKTTDLALEQLTKVKAKLLAEIDATEAANSASFRQLETALQAQLRETTAAEDLVRSTGTSGRAQQTDDLPKPVNFVGYTAKEDFGTELLLCVAALRTAVGTVQVQSVGQTRKGAYTNKYVPVTERKPTTPRDDTAKWVYEFRGAKKAFTPDFAATLERAYLKKETRCELRDKQQKLIFEVDLRTLTSYRPGDTSCGCPITREA